MFLETIILFQFIRVASKDLLSKKSSEGFIAATAATVDPAPFDVFSRWRQTGITNEMISCCAGLIVNNATSEISPTNFKRISLVQVHNESIKVGAFYPNATTRKNRPGSPSRLNTFKTGVFAAIEYAKNHMNISHFPDFRALFMSSDDSKLVRDSKSRCECSNVSYSWPPILAQNREYIAGNLFVTVPDFSFFADFKQQSNHGSKEDVWFDLLKDEVDGGTRLNSTYRMISFHSKPFPQVVWRGTIQKRSWKKVRAAVSNCNITGTTNTDGDYISRPQMCSKYQLILTIPGNGAWSWATKFNLVTLK